MDDSVYLDWIAKTAVHFDGMPGRWHEDIDRLDNFQRSPLGENYYHFDNATFNSLITQLKSTADPEQRKEIGFQLQEILVEEVPCIPVFSQDAFMAYRSDRFVGWDSARSTAAKHPPLHPVSNQERGSRAEMILSLSHRLPLTGYEQRPWKTRPPPRG